MAINMYSPSDVILLIGGVLKVGGYSEGTFLEITKDIAPTSSKRALDGTTHKMYIRDGNYSVKFTLAQSSETNEKLSRIQYLDEVTQKVQFPILIKDSLGTSMFFSPVAWIEGIPSQVYSSNMESRTWMLRATKSINFLGGSGEVSTSDTIINTLLAAAPNYSSVIGDIF